MDGHQFRGARIYRDMMLVSTVVCVVGLSVVSGGDGATQLIESGIVLELHAASVPHTDL
jgi:hypothetical protein